MSELILIRHGQSQWNLENRFTGWKDVDLSDLGIQEAKAAAAKIENDHVDIAFTSALKRAQHTLSIILEDDHLENIPVIKDAALNERCYGDLEGLNKAETAVKFGAEQVHIWRRSYDVQPPGGESLKDTYDRVLPFFKSQILPELVKGKNVLIVAHGNSLRSLIMYLQKLTPEQILATELATGIPVIYNISQKSAEEMSRDENFEPQEPLHDA